MGILELAEWAERLNGNRSDAGITELRAFNDAVHCIVPEPKTVVPLNYGSSIDAAMTLVSCSRAILNIAEDGITTAIVGGNEGCASTPALALCIASLRAREHG